VAINVEGRKSDLQKFHIILRRRKRQSHKSETQLQGLGFLAIGLSSLDCCNGFYGIECDWKNVCVVDVEITVFRVEGQFQRRLGVLRPTDNVTLYGLWERAIIAKELESPAAYVCKFNCVSSR
jgi:hypothetical protein